MSKKPPTAPTRPLTVTNRIVPIGYVHPHPRNYNVHSEQQIQQLAASYRRFGQFRSVVAVEESPDSYCIVAGHGITEAMQREGATEVRLDALPKDTPDATIEAILIADNLHSHNSTQNDELLAMLLQEQQDAGFDLTALGTDEETLRQLLENLGDGLLDRDGEGYGSARSLYRDEDEDIDAGFNGEAKLRFEAGRAGGAFAVHDLRTWDDARIARFKAWKDAPDLETAECERMAAEIATCLRAFFGGTLPPLVLTIPPRGQSAGKTTPYPAGVLAARVSALLGVDLVECLARAEADTTAGKGRARHTNLADASHFRVTHAPEVLTVILDDVTTTGSTLARAWSILSAASVPTVRLAYVVWHTRLEAPNHA